MTDQHNTQHLQLAAGAAPAHQPAATPDQPDAWREVQLWGGAVLAQLPARFADVSDVREVPDHQEVWADAHTDQSVILEIAEHSSDVLDADVGRFAFDDMAAGNEASSSSINATQQLGHEQVPHMPAGTYGCLVTGSIQASKGRDRAELANSVLLLLAVLRLPQHGADLLVTVNAPLFVAPGSSAGVDAAGSQPAAQATAAAVMAQLLRSLQIVDWGLFGGGAEAAAGEEARQ